MTRALLLLRLRRQAKWGSSPPPDFGAVRLMRQKCSTETYRLLELIAPCKQPVLTQTFGTLHGELIRFPNEESIILVCYLLLAGVATANP